VRIVVVGCGRMGAHLALRLVAAGHDVCVIDDNPDSFDRLGQDYRGRIVIGTGIDEDVLREAGADQPGAAVLAVTNVDATNFMVAQVARNLFGVQRVAVRINDPELEPLVAGCGFAVINLPDLAARHISGLLDAAAAGRP
jgi:trk system potassium uptake protein TrkA